MPEPEIYLYGSIHSPWCQAVLLTLHMKKLKYSFSSALDLQTIVESYKQGMPTPMWFPALWYNGKCYYESPNIIELLDTLHPSPKALFSNISEEEVTSDLQYAGKLFSYALTRVSGWKKVRFWYEWSIQKDEPGSTQNRILSCFFRPFTTLYFWVLLNIAYHIIFKGKWPKQIFRQSISYFSQVIEKSSGPHLNGSEVTYIDIILLGHFQCMFSGSTLFGALSEEVIPIIDEYPNIWEWLNHMHQHPSFADYPYMYSKCYMLQRTGEAADDDASVYIEKMFEKALHWLGLSSIWLCLRRGWFGLPRVEPEGLLGQLFYWLGLLAMIQFWPCTLLAILIALGERMWKLKGTYTDPTFKFKHKKAE